MIHPSPITEPEPRPRSATPRSLKRSVSCGRCGEPLYYPTTLNRRTAILCCGRCGAQTPIPTRATRALKIACVIFYLVAVALVVTFAMHRS
jgi:hypothetical protein